MKAIMKSLKPKTCANVMNLIQTILVIKNKREAKAIQKLIDENGYADIYVYCTKNNKTHHLAKAIINGKTHYGFGYKSNIESERYTILNSKVVFKFRCYKVEEIEPFEEFDSPMGLGYKLTAKKIITCQKAQLTYDEYNHYLRGKNGYTIHISNLEIFDEPKELSDFYHYVKYNEQQAEENKQDWDFIQITKAPKNYCYIDVSL